MRKSLFYIFAILILTACSDHVALIDDDTTPKENTGEEILFTTGIRTVNASTRVFSNEDELNAEVTRYHAMNYPYELSIQMYSKDGGAAPVTVGNPVKFTPLPVEDHYAEDGTLALVADEENPQMPLYWPSNDVKYGFELKANQTALAADQSTEDKWYANDKLLGYSFEPTIEDNIDAINFRTSREWYAKNKDLRPETDGGTPEDWKKIPIYVKHQRARITVMLKAGKGVKREDLRDPAKISTIIYSYDSDGNRFEVNLPLKSTVAMAYGENDEDVTTQFDAIVEPYNYLEHHDKDIFRISLNSGDGSTTGLNFTYNASNDTYFNSYNGTDDKSDLTIEAVAKMQAYNLTAGKHIVITATLTTDRVILMTAELKDWEDMTMMSICDDYGQNGDPIIIGCRARLLKFLADSEENKPGNVALVSATALDLDSISTENGNHILWKDEIKFDLNCTLNLAGAILHTDAQFVKDINTNGTIVNGFINVTNPTPGETAVCTNNKGMLQQVSLTVNEDIRLQTAATRAGFAVTNYGTIYNCSTELRVKNSNTTAPSPDAPIYIGGIAAESKYLTDENNATIGGVPTIEYCTVNSRVGTFDDNNFEGEGEVGVGVTGVGGIVGYAEGLVMYNTNNYGMTLMQQSKEKYKNIIAVTAASGDNMVQAQSNWWPTKSDNTIGKEGYNNVNANTAAKYYGVIDSQKELEYLLTKVNGTINQEYCIADNFSIGSDWQYGMTDSELDEHDISHPDQLIKDLPAYNINFLLDGNDKTITTHGKMLFSHINGSVSNLILECAKDLTAAPTTNSTDAIAPFAFAVNSIIGENGGTAVNGGRAVLENIRVKMADGKTITAATPSGLVVWAYDNALISNCEVNVNIQVRYAAIAEEAKKYSGGIAAVSSVATFTGCTVHSGTSIALPTDKDHTPFRGGIVGGVYPFHSSPQETSATTIIDCISWWGEDKGEGVDAEYPEGVGAIIGTTQYEIGTAKYSGTTGCEGNWWTTGKPASNLGPERKDYESALGYKNNSGPTSDVINY